MGRTPPQIRLDAVMFIIPSLIVTSRILGQDLVKKLFNYSVAFSLVLEKHLSAETEISLEDGKIKTEFQVTISQLSREQGKLQYRKNLEMILIPWRARILGNPVYPTVHNIVDSMTQRIIDIFEAHIHDIQAGRYIHIERTAFLLERYLSEL